MNEFTKTEIRNLKRICDAISKSKKMKDFKVKDANMDLSKTITIKEWWGQLDEDEINESLNDLKSYNIKAKKTGKTRYDEFEIEMTGKPADFIRANEELGMAFESLGLDW